MNVIKGRDCETENQGVLHCQLMSALLLSIRQVESPHH